MPDDRIVVKLCECGAEFSKRPKDSWPQWLQRSHCSAWCRAVCRVIAGEARPHSDGYRLLYVPMHPDAHRGYVYEHRIVMERVVGRLLASSEYVHHRNENKADNRPGNLEIMASSRHVSLHKSGVSDDEVATMLADGATQREITARGVSGHRVCRIRKSLRAAA